MSQNYDPWKRVDALEAAVRELEARLRALEQVKQPVSAVGKVIPGGTLHVPQKGQH